MSSTLSSVSSLPFHLFTDLSSGHEQDKAEAAQLINISESGVIMSLTLPDKQTVEDQQAIVEHFKKSLAEEYGTHIANLVFKEKSPTELTTTFIREIRKTADVAAKAETSDAAAYTKALRVNAALARSEAKEAIAGAKIMMGAINRIQKLEIPETDLQAVQSDLEEINNFKKQIIGAAKEARSQANQMIAVAKKADRSYANAKNKSDPALIKNLQTLKTQSTSAMFKRFYSVPFTRSQRSDLS